MEFLKKSLNAHDKVSMKVKTYECPLPEVPIQDYDENSIEELLH